MQKIKSVGIVDFHAAINYGSALLAYALQETISRMGYECKIVNYQPKEQIACYQLPILVSRHPVKRWIESLYWLKYNHQMEEKYEKFRSFSSTYLKTTPYCSNPDSINETCGEFDCYVAGGDQIWNTHCVEFEWYYYLNFVKDGCKKIAYAPSMGPAGKNEIKDEEEIKRVLHEVSTFQHVAVRDSGTATFFPNKPEVVLDPTMLLPVEEWSKLAGDKPLVEGEYIFYYDPFDHVEGKLAAKKYAKVHQCKIVASNIYQIFQKDEKTFDYRLNVGPLEFLNLIKFAKSCIGRSFHLCVFSLLFQKKFQMVGGLVDQRNLELAVSLFDDIELLKSRSNKDLLVYKADYTKSFEDKLIFLRDKSLNLLEGYLVD